MKFYPILSTYDVRFIPNIVVPSLRMTHKGGSKHVGILVF